MYELIQDPFYETLKEYGKLVVDYCLMKSDSYDRGYSSHKEAVLFAMHRICEQYPWISVDADRAIAEKLSPEKLFSFPEKPWKDNAHGTTLYHVNYTEGEKIPYWYAFLAPPHGTGQVFRNGKLLRDRYGREDFDIVNRALFPRGIEDLEVYDWSTDWSDYFDAGREWWGTFCCSIYDKKLDRYAVLMASSTD